MKTLNKLKYIFNIIKRLLKSEAYFIYTINDKQVSVETSGNLLNIDNSLYKDIILNVKELVINNKYNGNVTELFNELETIDPDLANAYKELEYLDALNQYLELEYLYFKDMNTPGIWIDGNMAYIRYNRVLELKKKCDMLKSQL